MCDIGSIFVSLKKLSFFLTRRILYTKSDFCAAAAIVLNS